MTLQAQQISCVRGERQLFGAIDVALDAGDALRLAGANGSGKTSLLRILAGLLAPEAGEVRWQGQAVASCRDTYHAALIYIGHGAALKDDLLAWENLVCAQALAGRDLTEAQARAALHQAGLGRAAGLPARVLSQGQRKRLALARLACNPHTTLWLLDEPFSALDAAASAALAATIDAHLARGGMLVYTTHQDVALKPRRALALDLDGARA